MFRFAFALPTILFLALTTGSSAASDTLEEYAAKCDLAIGAIVPDFNCDAATATEVPVTHFSRGACDRPNQLNEVCDPGSRFQVLPSFNPSAFVVAHCRKQNMPAGQYGDIAVIQHNKVNGATCFYQGALPGLSHSGDVKAPIKGVGSPQFWMTPGAIAASEFRCGACHDNGPIIRSPYLTQITGNNALPGARDPTFNRDQPYYFVGSDFASWKAYKVELNNGNTCNGCHRMGVNNLGLGPNNDPGGTARDFGLRATASSQKNKNPHSAASPMWMLLDQPSYSQFIENEAKAIQNCANKFRLNEPLPNEAHCKITEFTGMVVARPSSASMLGPVLDYLIGNSIDQSTLEPIRNYLLDLDQ